MLATGAVFSWQYCKSAMLVSITHMHRLCNWGSQLDKTLADIVIDDSANYTLNRKKLHPKKKNK